ncbi:hypothetical protein BV898_18395 [Hypsibius exemplaris]|uniref:ETS domain-containing protein n=1 Tax=Hypsibius exemplaris TaxID=2072580 RepID=A0A9X6NHC3_HYPEX|nr:hypothetical protein BV898_18395 [Hypsibius exemplaris]
MDPEKYAATLGFHSESAKRMVVATILNYRHNEKLRAERESQREIEERRKAAELLQSLYDNPQCLPPLFGMKALAASTHNAGPKTIRNSDRLASKKREGQEFTFQVSVQALLCEEIFQWVEPKVDFRVSHLPVYVSTSHFPERLSPKASVNELYGGSSNGRAEIQVVVGRQRLDILLIRQLQTPEITSPLSTVSGGGIRRQTSTAPLKFDQLMEKVSRKRSRSNDEADLLPASFSDPPMSPLPPALPVESLETEVTRSSGGKKRKMGKVDGTEREERSGGSPLYLFILGLLAEGREDVVYWTGNVGEFRIKSSSLLAKLWGEHRQNDSMTYDKVARALRYYYTGPSPILATIPQGRRSLTYRFILDRDMKIHGHSYWDLIVPRKVELPRVPSPRLKKPSPADSRASSSTESEDSG